MRWAEARGFLDVMSLTVNGLDKGLLARLIETPVEPAMATDDIIVAFVSFCTLETNVPALVVLQRDLVMRRGPIPTPATFHLVPCKPYSI